MCSIVRISGKVKDIVLKDGDFVCDTYDSGDIYEMLDKKGGDDLNVSIRVYDESETDSDDLIDLLTLGDNDNEYDSDIYVPDTNNLKTRFFKGIYISLYEKKITSTDFSEFNSQLKQTLEKIRKPYKDKNIILLFHSRLEPEMESNNVEKQPYFNIDNEYVAVHGTIPKAEEIAEKYNFKIDVDTDIFKHLSIDVAIDEVEKVGGKITVISETGQWTNGLGLYEKGLLLCRDNPTIVTNIEHYDLNSYSTFEGDNTRVKVILSTGGLDITCSTISELTDIYYGEIYTDHLVVEHWYFDWGSNASEAEQKAVRNLINVYREKFKDSPSIEFKDLCVFDIKDMFKNILDVSNVKNIRIADKNAIGEGKHEAESDISYVPFRNTYLMTTAAAIAEQLYPNQWVEFIIGANLSEGMIYLDNSSEWVSSMNKLVKVGGQKCYKYEVKAPFVNVTKTKMLEGLKYDIETLLELDLNAITFSCYFPTVDGEKCGKCGSCLLKEQALLKAGYKNSN